MMENYQIEKVDIKLSRLIEKCSEYNTKNTIIQSMQKIGNVVAFNLLSDMPKLGYLTNKESGRYEGQRNSRGGHHKIQTVMYMAMMSDAM